MISINNLHIQIKPCIQGDLRRALDYESDETKLNILVGALAMLQQKDEAQEQNLGLGIVRGYLDSPFKTMLRNQSHTREDLIVVQLLSKIALLEVIVEETKALNLDSNADIFSLIKKCQGDLKKDWETIGSNYLTYLQQHHQPDANGVYNLQVQRVISFFIYLAFIYATYAITRTTPEDVQTAIQDLSSLVRGEGEVDTSKLGKDIAGILVDVLGVIILGGWIARQTYNRTVSSEGLFSRAIQNKIAEQRRAIQEIKETVEKLTPTVEAVLSTSLVDRPISPTHN